MAEKKLSKKSIFKSYVNWMMFNLSLYQPETMQAPALVKMFGDVREELYPNDPEKQKELLQRHLPFFNTEPFLGCLIPGIALGMEAEKAAGEDVPDELITAIKSALMGPFAGIGDALLPGTFVPVLIAIGCGLSGNGSVLGAIFYIVVFLGVMIPLTWMLFNKGVELGASAAELILGNDLKDDIINALNIVGLMVVGCIACAYATINISWTYVRDGVTIVDLGALINGVWPKLPVYLAAIGTYLLMAKKNWSTNKVILLYLIVAIVGYFTHILGA
ncbi:MAG: PTS system mannose/fructose/sorbose family transporter subunit IID [Erysipelotrichia bacterium]|nr:PTS system mannose/fructose/sorbose family transporter subunit IID [Erysipelotrichia bacterium]